MSCFYGNGSVISIVASAADIAGAISWVLFDFHRLVPETDGLGRAEVPTFLRSEGVSPPGTGHLRPSLLVTLQTCSLDAARGAALSPAGSSASVFLSPSCCFSHLPSERRCERWLILFVSADVTSFASDDQSPPDGAVASSCSGKFGFFNNQRACELFVQVLMVRNHDNMASLLLRA